MNTPNAKTLVKINAALALIHDAGHDAKAVGRAAQTNISAGMTQQVAYERALSDFATGRPDIAPRLLHTLRLIDASDPQTVAAYGQALAAYNQTGDPAAMQSVAEMYARDSIAFAVKSGQLSAADAQNREKVEAALGFSFDDLDMDTGSMSAYEPASPANTPAIATAQHASSPSGFSGKDAAPGASYAPSRDRAAPVIHTPTARMAFVGKSPFSGKDAAQGGSYSGGFQSDRRYAQHQAGQPHVVQKGWTPNPSFGGRIVSTEDQN
ncbi:hypothetical protein LWE61_08220 [Sphingobium sufflavum]|uniref:hypothetical protein n=1 Tax=Sphingobium sufflavum TaxID=1129547 RepID=UPI001F1C2697|nr:hypothetical protein [Sphingobium sufflavum]MCE7796547.1 hypothetical protein [Sphingobium sufflavum]